MSFADTATTEIYTLSLHDALPISRGRSSGWARTSPIERRCGARSKTSSSPTAVWITSSSPPATTRAPRSEEHTSELQSHSDLVCRLLLEKKKENWQSGV